MFQLNFIFKVLLFLHIIFFPIQAYAEYYTTESFNVYINIKEDRTFEITEEITVNYTEPRRGIFRYIPKNGTFILGEDLKDVFVYFNATLTNPQVLTYKYAFGKDNNEYYFQIGDANTYVEGRHTYKLSYNYQYNDDELTDFDLVYHNVIPHQWPSAIENAKITITLPKDFNSNDLEITSGKYLSNVNKTSYKIDGNTIIIENTDILDEFEGITLFIPLPDGYFTNSFQDLTPWAIFTIVSSLVLTLLTCLHWWFTLKTSKVPEPISFYPPRNLNPVETAYIMNGDTSVKDFSSLLIYFAHTGNLSIESINNKQIEVCKIKNLDENAKNHEKVFFNEIFAENSVLNINLQAGKFYAALEKSVKALKSDYKKEKMFISTRWLIYMIYILLCFYPYFILGFGDYSGLQTAVPISGFLGIISLLIFIICRTKRLNQTAKGIRFKIGISILSPIIIFCLYIPIVISSELYNSITVGIVAILCSISMALLASTDFGRTKKCQKLLGEIKGFKKFIEISEADKLNSLINDKPEYFFDILPYAYVFNLSTEWIDKLQLVQTPTESPLYTTKTYSKKYSTALMASLTVATNVSSLIAKTKSQIDSANSSSSSGGGSSGGGGGRSSSGGGGGGGGGGSW